MSQEELAAKAQVSRTTVQNWENDRSRPRRAESRRLAAALGLSVDELKARAEKFAEPLAAVQAEDLPQLVEDLRDLQQERITLDASPARGAVYKVISRALDQEIIELQQRIQRADDANNGDTPREYGS